MKTKIIIGLFMCLVLVGAGAVSLSNYDQAKTYLQNYENSNTFNFEKDISNVKYTSDKECVIGNYIIEPACEVWYEYEYDKKVYTGKVSVYSDGTLEEEAELIRYEIKERYNLPPIEVEFVENRNNIDIRP